MTDYSRRAFMRAAGVGAAALAVSSCGLPWRQSRGKRPNFLFILTDDQVYRAMGYVNPAVKTPNLDRLASEGIIFEQAFTVSPLCVASRASLFTGVYPQQHASVGLDVAGFEKNVIAGDAYRTFPELLRDHGYHTGYCGKSDIGEPRDFGFSAGVEERDVDDHRAFVFAHEYLRARAADGQPFLLFVSPDQPHMPLLPTQEWLDLYRDVEIQPDLNFRESPPPGSLYNQGLPGEQFYRDSEFVKNHQGLPGGPPRTREQISEFMRAYYATISRLDHQIGELAKTLADCGLDDDTVLIFTSDNGYHLGNHGLGNKTTMHEESVRVPLFVRWNALPAAGVRSRALVSNLDFYSTLLELARISAPPWLEGLSLVPVLHNPQHEFRPYIFAECVGQHGKVGQGHRMVRGRQWKYILTDVNEEALFDLAADPYEMNNLAGDALQQQRLVTMRAQLRDWMNQIGDTHAPPK